MSKADDSKARATAQYAPLPGRAIGDERLTVAHFRVLAAIASYDRLGANGAGCYATQTTLADLTGLYKTTVSRRIRELEAWGYLRIERQAAGSSEHGRRRKQYYVIYDSCSTEQVSCTNPGNSCSSAPDTCPTEHDTHAPRSKQNTKGRKDKGRRARDNSMAAVAQRATERLRKTYNAPDGEEYACPGEYYAKRKQR